MANTFITPSVIARLAYAHLYERTIMGQLVYRDYEADFNGAVGDTISVRRPAQFEAEAWNEVDGITVQNATETSFTVTLDTILDVSFAVPSMERSLDIRSVQEQLVVPAVEALVQEVEKRILAMRSGISREVGHAGGLYAGGEDYDDPKVLIDARRALNEKNVPMGDRYAVIGPAIEAGWLADSLFHQADQRGDTEGLREASIGRKFGFDIFSTTHIEPQEETPEEGDPTTEVGIAFHRTALALVMRTLPMPEGAANAATFGDRGVGIRVVRDYDIDKKKDIVSLDVLMGVKVLDPNRAVLIKGADFVDETP